jgi:hypothetical protein
LALFAAALLAFPVALFAFTAGASFLVRGGDGVEAGPDHRAGGLGCAAHDRRRAADDGAHEAALEHQTAAENNGALHNDGKAILTRHVDHSRDLEQSPIMVNGG